MKARHLFIILSVLGLSYLWNRPVVTPDVPSSVLRAFLKDHPSATRPQYRFEADDAGIVFLVEFDEAGVRKSADYRYDEKEWLSDSENEIATTSVDDEDTSLSKNQNLRKTQF